MLACGATAHGETATRVFDKPGEFTAHNVTVAPADFKGRQAIAVQYEGAYRGRDRDTFAYVPGLDFHNGTIEVELAGAPLPGADAAVRGFVGIAFRIAEADGSFASEGIYLRPTNGRAEDQVRRNHATQYFAFPDYDFERLRNEAPGKYESYADLVPGEWMKMRIVVSGQTAKLFVNDAQQPALIVNDLKRGSDAHGSVGLWVGIGADAHFRNLRITAN